MLNGKEKEVILIQFIEVHLLTSYCTNHVGLGALVGSDLAELTTQLIETPPAAVAVKVGAAAVASLKEPAAPPPNDALH